MHYFLKHLLSSIVSLILHSLLYLMFQCPFPFLHPNLPFYSLPLLLFYNPLPVAVSVDDFLNDGDDLVSQHYKELVDLGRLRGAYGRWTLKSTSSTQKEQR